MRKFVEEHFWVLLIIALVFGLFVPIVGKPLHGLIMPILMVVLFLTYLKIDYLDVLFHVKQPAFVGYVLATYLLIIPALVYILFQFINPELAVAFLLLCAIPPGVASPLLTNLLKGNTSLSIAITFLSYIFAPFTVVLLFYLLVHKSIQLDLIGLSQTLLLINFLPLIVSQIVRKQMKTFIAKTQHYFSFTNIVLLTFMVYVIVANQAKEILALPFNTLLVDLFWLYILFLILFIGGYFLAFWRKKEDKVALGVSKSFMNNALTIGLAFAFFDPRVTILMVLSEIPWNTTLGPFKFLLKKLP